MANVNLETLPRTMRSLPVNERGYPVPWFVAWKDGKPEFRAMDYKKLVAAVNDRLCWVCGGKLGVNLSFVIGPMCGINRNTAEPPCHHDCAIWSAINCPFLSNPTMSRREDDQINNQNFREKTAGIGITRNPGVALVWNCRGYEVTVYDSSPLFTIGEPQSVEWFCEGRQATREEVQYSIDTGLPTLYNVAKTDGPESVRVLDRMVSSFNQKWLPA